MKRLLLGWSMLLLNDINMMKSKKKHKFISKIFNDYLLARDRSRRVIKLPQRLSYAYLIAFTLISASEVLNEEPRDYKEFVRSLNKTEWLKAMEYKMKSLHDNNT